MWEIYKVEFFLCVLKRKISEFIKRRVKLIRRGKGVCR